MGCEKALSEKPGDLSPSLGPSCYCLNLEQATFFSGLQFFPKDFD